MKLRTISIGRGLDYKMIIKIISLFLIGMVILAIFGRLRLPKFKLGPQKKCTKCGAPIINSSKCVCED